jgi:hypothetical protein
MFFRSSTRKSAQLTVPTHFVNHLAEGHPEENVPFKRRVMGLTTALAAAVLAIAVACPAAQAADVPTKSTVTSVPISPHPVASGPHRQAAPTINGNCPAVTEHLRQHENTTNPKNRYIGCLQRRPTTSAATTPQATSLAPADSPVWCTADGTDEWWATRTSACIAEVPLVFTLFDEETGEPIGSADLSFSDSITLDPSSSQFVETNYLTMVDEIDVPELLVTYNGLCASLCAPINPAAYADEPLVEGETISGTTTYNDAPPSLDTTTLSNEIIATVPDGVPITPSSVSGSPTVRCDSQIGSTTGCVYPAVTPDLNLSWSQSGAGAVFVTWAEQNLPAQYGWAVPLHRFTGVPDWSIQDNRDVVCDSSFVKDPTVDQDSCDEYAFASSEESGALNGVTAGTQCAEIKPFIDDVTGQWEVQLINPNTSANCARAHVSLPSNSSVGGVLGNFIKDNRVLDGDAYWVGTIA